MSALQALRKTIVSTASKFKDTNYRAYFIRRANEDFDAFLSKDRSDAEVAEFTKKMESHKAMLDRQSTIDQMYHSDTFDTKR